MTCTLQNATRKLALNFIMFLVCFMTACSFLSPDSILENEQRWSDASISSYRIQVLHVRSIWHAQTYIITVEDGQVISYDSECIPAPYEAGECKVEPFVPDDYTVPGLFELARRETTGEGAENVTIRFNEQYGYPEQISSDNPQAVDDDSSWSVRSFEPLP